MRYSVRHVTAYHYSEPVDLASHAVRLSPRSFASQRVLAAELDLSPAPFWSQVTRDSFGNEVLLVSIEEPHTTFTVTARCLVDVSFPPLPEPSLTPNWQEVRDRMEGDGFPTEIEAAEYLHASPLVRPNDAVRAYAVQSFPPGRPILEALLDLNGRIHRDFIFDPHATEVSTPLDEVMAARRGVCQDFAHVEIACLRSLGLPARYVSGYIRTRRPEGEPGLVGVDASHAWVSAFCPGIGWIDLDPTNDLVVSDEHVVVAWGRDYSDVSPVRGVILGGGNHRLDVAVEMG